MMAVLSIVIRAAATGADFQRLLTGHGDFQTAQKIADSNRKARGELPKLCCFVDLNRCTGNIAMFYPRAPERKAFPGANN
jgi:hypothetical protein